MKLIGVDHVGLASDDMFILSLVTKFAKENPESYDDEGYMLSAFEKGANCRSADYTPLKGEWIFRID